MLSDPPLVVMAEAALATATKKHNKKTTSQPWHAAYVATPRSKAGSSARPRLMCDGSECFRERCLMRWHRGSVPGARFGVVLPRERG